MNWLALFEHVLLYESLFVCDILLGFRKLKPETGRKQDDDEDRTVLGVDLGIINIATTSTTYFASGRELRHQHRVRADSQHPSADRYIICSSDDSADERKESRYLRDELHQVANQILEEARTHNCEYIAFENLKLSRTCAASERVPPVGAPATR